MSGGSSESSGSSKSYTGLQKKKLHEALNVYGPTVGQGQEVYQGTRVAPMTGTQTQVLAGLPDWANYFQNNNYQNMPLFGQTGTTLEGLLTGQTGAQPLSTEQANQSFMASRWTPAMQTFQQDTAPMIREEYAGPGYWSSARAGAVGDEAGRLQQQLEAQRASFLWDTEMQNQAIAEAKAGRALSAVPQAMEYGMMPTYQAQQNVAGLTDVFGLASAGQAQQQAEINANIEKFMEENRLTDPENIQILLALLGMNYNKQSQSTSEWNVSLPKND